MPGGAIPDSCPLCGYDTSVPERDEIQLPAFLSPRAKNEDTLYRQVEAGSEERVILFPEGAIKLQGTGRQVLEQCDGQRTFAEIIAELQKQFAVADPEKIRADISIFLEQLQRKRIVDY